MPPPYGVKQNRLCSDPAPTGGEMNLVGADLASALGSVVGAQHAAPLRVGCKVILFMTIRRGSRILPPTTRQSHTPALTIPNRQLS